MQTIIGVRFKQAGKIFYFSPGNLAIAKGDKVVVETARGVECGTVVTGPREVEASELKAPLKVVLRLASDRDMERIAENKEHEQEAFRVCEQKIAEHELPMKLVEVEYTFDLSKIIFYFTADGRIDFRDLVKDLAGVFRTRIELRQIGVRDEAKLMGGIGCCGRPLCCATFLGDFEPVSIRMAKEQNLSLNPTKISGICGRLMCCLKYENDCYENGCCGGCRSPQQSRIQAPEQGGRVIAAEGEGKVISVNQQRRTATILLDNSRTIVASWEDVVPKDEDEKENQAPSRVPRFQDDDEDDEVDSSLIAAITERSERAESLGEEGGESGSKRERGSRERRSRDKRDGGRRGEREGREGRSGGRDNHRRRQSGNREGERGERQGRRRNNEHQERERQESKRPRHSRSARTSRPRRENREGGQEQRPQGREE